MEYWNTGYEEPWEVTYDACLEDCGRLQETCGDGEGKVGGGIVTWDDGVLTVDVKYLK